MRFFSALVLALTVALAASGQPPNVPKVEPAKGPGVEGGEVKLVDRDQLRAEVGTKKTALTLAMRAAVQGEDLVVPPKWDWTKGHTINFPMLGNNQWGDCFYVAAVKFFIAANKLTTNTDVVFDKQKLVDRYLELSGGDNGLTGSQIFPEMKRGAIGPDGPHKILDYATVSSTDKVAMDLVQYAFGPTLFTFRVPPGLVNNVKAGQLWDTQSGYSRSGHAVLLTGKNERGNYYLETWGLNPPIEVTPRFIANNDPETTAVFSLEWFDKRGYAPNGLHYTTLAPLWTQITGGALPPSPFPPPVGPTPPLPPAPPAPPVTGPIALVVNGETITVDPVAKSVAIPAGWTGGPGKGLADELTAAGVPAAVVADIVKLAEDLKAKAAYPVLIADVLKLINDLPANPAPMPPAPAPTPEPLPPPAPAPGPFRQVFPTADGRVIEEIPGRSGVFRYVDSGTNVAPPARPVFDGSIRNALFGNPRPILGGCPGGVCPAPARR